MGRRQLKAVQGFTLIELTISLVVMGILAGILAPFLLQGFDAWSVGVAQSYTLDQHREALAAFSQDVESSSQVNSANLNRVQVTISGVGLVTYELELSGNGRFNLIRISGGVRAVVSRNVRAGGIQFRYLDRAQQETDILSRISVVMITLTTHTLGGTYTSGTSALMGGLTPSALSRF